MNRAPELRYAWYVVLALTAIYMLSYMDRVILSLLVAPMKRDFGISDTQVGLMQGLAFALFYTLVGFHGFHVSIGVLWLATLWCASLSNRFDKLRALSVELAGLYWHFVDVVWVVIFTLVYLMQQVKGA